MGLFSKQYDFSLLRTTSKDALKRSALFISGGDIKAAAEIYDFFVRDIPNMPDFDPPEQSGYDRTKETITGVLSWLDANQEKLMGYYNLFRSMRSNSGNIPPLP